MSTDTNDIVSGGLFIPIEPLKLNDTFYTWYTTTNEIIDALNPLAIYDVSGGPGITVTKISGGNAVISVSSGCGIKFDNNISLTLDISGTQETTAVQSEDYYILEKYEGTNITTDSSDCETLFKVQATNLLPYVVSGDHDFIGGDTSTIVFSSINFSVESTSVEFKATNIFLNDNPSATTDDDYELRQNLSFVGFTVHAGDEDPTFGFVGDLLAWKSNQNFSVTSTKSFVSDSASTDAVFNFSTKEASQEDVFVKLLTGSRTSDGDIGKVFGIHANDSINKLSFTFENEQSTDGQINLFTAKYLTATEQTEFSIDGKIFIRDIEDSNQFLTISDNTSYKVPITNTKGVLDHKFTNRFVTNNYDPTLSIGDVVKFVYSDNTNTTEDIYVTGAQADSENNSRVVGIVELISGGYVTIALNGVCNYTGASSGQVYYLSQSTAGQVVTTKPSTGIVKEVFVGIDDSTVLVFASSTLQTQNFGVIDVDGSYTISAETYGDSLSVVAGSNISLSVNTENQLVITAGTLVDADYWKTIVTDSGSFSALTAEDTLTVNGNNGITTGVDSNNSLVISAPNSYSTIEIVGENTDELDYILNASTGTDTLTIRSGIGINITSSTNNDIVIEATGLSVPANRSITNQKLAEMPAYSIKAAQSNGEPVDVYQSQEFFEISYPVLADYYNVYSITDSNGDTYPVFQDPVSLIEYPTIYSTVLGQRLSTGTPDAVAGYVYGRVVDEAGNVTDIKPLNRRELRLLMGASETGFLEENSKVFNSWTIWTDEFSGASSTAETKNGTLNIIQGVGISLSVYTLPSGSDAIQITATGDTARFGTVINDTTSESLDATVIGSTLHVVERDAVGIDVNSNNALDFYIKSGSITNDMLNSMSENTVKVRTAGTDSTGPEDLLIGENEILGRLSGQELKSLSASEVRTLIGLTSSDYFKAITCYTGVTLTGTVNASSTETLTLRGGTNITLSILGDNSIEINALTDDTTGIKTIGFTETGSLYTPTHITFDELSVSGSGGLYSNIDIIPVASSGGNLTVQFDLGVMPQRSVKVASSTYNASREGYLATNLIVQQGHVLGVLNDGTSVSSIPFSTLIANSGINYYSSIGVNGSTISASGPSKLTLLSAGDTNMSVVGSTITISSTSTVESDTTPTLGGNLDVNGKYFMVDSYKSLYLSKNSSSTSNHYLNIYNDSSKTELRILRDVSLPSSVDLVLTPYGTGTVISKTYSSSSLNNLTMKTGTSDGKLFVDGNNSNYTIISCVASKNLYLSPGTSSSDVNLYFDNGTNTRSLITRRSGNDTGIIHANSSGNLVLAAGYTGSGFSTGSNYIMMNSDVMLDSTKSIVSNDNIVKVSTTDAGYFKISGSSKANTQKVYSNSFDSTLTRVIDSYSLSAIGKSVKYIVRGESSIDPTDSFVLEFNAIISATEVVQDVISKIYTSGSPLTTQNIIPSITSNGTTVQVSLNTISGTYSLTIYRTSLT